MPVVSIIYEANPSEVNLKTSAHSVTLATSQSIKELFAGFVRSVEMAALLSWSPVNTRPFVPQAAEVGKEARGLMIRIEK